MAGDYTRTTFTSRKDHSGVLMQQGRVTLDADWNEQVDLLDHRLRAEIVDTLGRCVFSRETPDAFLIGLAGGALTIGRGRAFVDGILAECHGSGALAFDPVLADEYGVDPVDYLTQPYYPNPDPLPKSGTYVAYLDVWEREVTYLEDPELVEKAIAVDTATRVQNAWQVKLLEGTGDMDCDTQLAAWDALTAPSAGRLTTTAVGVPVATDPCTIPPSGGYRGTENRLYRVEIQDPGPLGTATFKWSRDNASIGSHVDAIDTARKTLTLVRLGRDGVRRIRVDDWVEVTDDWRELHQLPGELRKVVTVDEVNETATLDTALPAGAFDATDPTRHTRVTRWDEAGAAVDAANGVVAVPAVAGTAIVLEDGVQVSFDTDPAGGDFHVGDYWVFAARTADASVEQLLDEPPRGIHHHYCRLGVVTFPDGPVIDCRRPPAEECDCDCSCDVCVTPESHATGTMTIQAAVDIVAKTGGKVCLQVGLYRLQRPVLIRGARSIELVGKGWKTILLSNGRLPAIVVETSLGVTIDRMTIVTATLSKRGAVPTGIAIYLRNTIGTIIERCVLVQLGLIQQPPGDGDPGDPGDPGNPDPCPPENLKVGVRDQTTTVDYANLFGPKGAGAPLIALDGIVIETLIKENLLVGTTGIGTLWGAVTTSPWSMTAMDVGIDDRIRTEAATTTAQGSGYLLTYDLTIDDNRFLCWLNGITLEGFSMQLGETRIHGNSLLVCLRAGIATTGITGPGGRIDVTGNLLSVLGYGIVAGTDDTRIVDNDVRRIEGFGATQAEDSTVGLSSYAFASPESNAASYLAFFGGDAIVLAPSVRPGGIDRCQVRGNRVFGVVGNGIAIRTPVTSALVADNIVQTVGGNGITMEGRAAARVLGIERNQILNVGLLAREGRTGHVAGILVVQSEDVAIVGNTVEGVAVESSSASRRWGIATSTCRGVRITGNIVSDVGPPVEFAGQGVGIAIFAGFGNADVLDNTSRRSAILPRQPQSNWIGILIDGGVRERDLLGEYEAALEKAFENANNIFGIDIEGGRITRFPRGKGSLAVRGNLVQAYGRSSAVWIDADTPCLFNDNRCFLAAPDGTSVATVNVAAAIASNNFLDGPDKAPALDLTVSVGDPFTILGNITSTPIAVNGSSPPPAPWTMLNT